ncbi:MAG: CvpA family protein [Paracoccaceae bacterium]|jgi:membrane protein required for colicin V production|nr:CvpA family protein [Paracoccaceae bacterium]MDG1370848.1 CvpA family protein [Paracoccaceae bacterium]MDG1972745.1 CvpA family protein [Paracoccaceae bacterium]
MEFTLADGAVALIVLVSAFLAYNRGVTREALAIGGWIVAGLAAFYFAPMVSPLVLEIPVVANILRSSCTLTVLASFAIVFSAALLILSIFTPLLSSAVQDTVLGPIDRALGFLFGIARGVLLIGVLYLLYDTLVNETDRIAMIDQSFSHGFISDAAEAIQAQAPTAMPEWLQSRIDQLMGECTAPGDDQAAYLRPFRLT